MMESDLTKCPAEVACAEPGRQMFFDYAGRYFAVWPKSKACPKHTPCVQCGSTSVQLWESASGTPTCIAQSTITRKRAARKSPDEPLTPVAGDDGKGSTALSDGHFVIAGPAGATLITNLRPNAPIPDSLTIKWGGIGSMSAARRELLLNPPPTPFVAIIFTKKASHPVEITVDTSAIAINGKDGATIERDRLMELLPSLEGLTPSQFDDILKLRDRLSGTTPYRKKGEKEKDQERLIALRESNTISPKTMRRLPQSNSKDSLTLRTLLSPSKT